MPATAPPRPASHADRGHRHATPAARRSA
jgi:hypothetical protein